MNEVSVPFTLDELWFLQSVIRHDMAGAFENWEMPPVSIDLNDQIAEAILLCEDGADEAHLVLSRHSCLVIDYCVDASARDINGKPIGRNILLKSFRARMQIKDGDSPLYNIVEEPHRNADEVAAKLHEWGQYQQEATDA